MPISELNACMTLCNNDAGCKGLAMYTEIADKEPDKHQCHLATESECPENCDITEFENNLGPLDPTSICNKFGPNIDPPRHEYWNGGCHRKIPGGGTYIVIWKICIANQTLLHVVL